MFVLRIQKKLLNGLQEYRNGGAPLVSSFLFYCQPSIHISIPRHPLVTSALSIVPNSVLLGCSSSSSPIPFLGKREEGAHKNFNSMTHTKYRAKFKRFKQQPYCSQVKKKVWPPKVASAYLRYKAFQ